jgi:excisionase family DNA binding protein
MTTDALKVEVVRLAMAAGPDRLRAAAAALSGTVEPGRTVTVTSAAALLGVSRQTVYGWIRAAKIERIPYTNRLRRDDVARLAEQL